MGRPKSHAEAFSRGAQPAKVLASEADVKALQFDALHELAGHAMIPARKAGVAGRPRWPGVGTGEAAHEVFVELETIERLHGQRVHILERRHALVAQASNVLRLCPIPARARVRAHTQLLEELHDTDLAEKGTKRSKWLNELFGEFAR